MIRRRRECEHCKKRFTTYERIENIPLIVVKKSGQREPYDRNKIYNGIIKSCEKRPVAIATIEKLVDNLERELYQIEDKEVSSIYIGERVMNELKKIDQVAYVRFASVYREFKDVETFKSELDKLMAEWGDPLDNEEKIVTSEVLYAGKILDLKLNTVELPNGELAKREIVKHRNGVGVLPVDGDTMLFVKQYRSAIED